MTKAMEEARAIATAEILEIISAAEKKTFEWSGSAFLADEKLSTDDMSESEHKSALYSDLCRLGNNMAWLKEEITTALAAKDAEIERLREALTQEATTNNLKGKGAAFSASDALTAGEREPVGTVADIVPAHCTGKSLAFSEGVLHVNKDGSGWIGVDEQDFDLEDDRCEGPDGPQGSVHWITRFPADEMQSLRDFLCGVPFTAPPASELEALRRELAESNARAEGQWAGWVREQALHKKTKARLAELEKALEPFACAIEPDSTTLSGWKFGNKPKHEHFVAARRVRDGGQADG